MSGRKFSTCARRHPDAGVGGKPLMLIGLVVGVIISLFQALTQIRK
jgi:hypothetical protein